MLVERVSRRPILDENSGLSGKPGVCGNVPYTKLVDDCCAWNAALPQEKHPGCPLQLLPTRLNRVKLRVATPCVVTVNAAAGQSKRARGFRTALRSGLCPPPLVKCAPHTI